MRIIIVSLLILLATSTYGQVKDTVEVEAKKDSEDILKNNELKVELVRLLGLGYLEGSYERIINKKSAIGVAVGFTIGNKNPRDMVVYNFNILPYYRAYLTKNKRPAGFFVEANTALYSERFTEYIIGGQDRTTRGVGFGFGVGVGGKFLTKGGWIFEIFFGLGKNLISRNELTRIYTRGLISVGRRF